MVKIWVLIILFSIAWGMEKFLGIMINTSPSMPLGIYIKKFSKIKRGDIVAICLDSSQTQLGLQRHYLKPGFDCEGTEPLIKQIIAIPGDDVILTDHDLKVNKKLYFYPTFYRDQKNNLLPVFPRGTYASTHGYWLLGTHNPHSWDSRYWGFISRSQIIENLMPFFTWD